MSISEEIEDYVGEDFAEAMGKAEEIWGTVNGAYAAYKYGKDALIFIGIIDKPEDPLKKIHEALLEIQEQLDKILGALEKVRLEQAGIDSHLTRMTFINDETNARTAAYNAYWYMESPNSSQNEDLYKNSQATAQNSVNHFRDNTEYWRRVYLESIDYTDEWSGTISPTTSESNKAQWVWDFVITLPAYLSSLASWCIVILAADKEFQRAHLFEGSEILGHINKLHEILVKILQSFEPIRPPTPYEMKYLLFALDDKYFYQLGTDGAKYYLKPDEITGQLKHLPGGKWRLSGYRCGMVERHNGWARYEAYPTAELAEGLQYLKITGSFWLAGPETPEGGASISVTNQEAFDAFYNRFLIRHTLRTWKQARVLSDAFGLQNLYHCLNNLCSIRGIEPPALPPEWNRYATTSMREMYAALPPSLSASMEYPGLRKMSELVSGDSGTVSLADMT